MYMKLHGLSEPLIFFLSFEKIPVGADCLALASSCNCTCPFSAEGDGIAQSVLTCLAQKHKRSSTQRANDGWQAAAKTPA